MGGRAEEMRRLRRCWKMCCDSYFQEMDPNCIDTGRCCGEMSRAVGVMSRSSRGDQSLLSAALRLRSKRVPMDALQCTSQAPLRLEIKPSI